MALNKYLVIYQQKALSVTHLGKEFHRVDSEFFNAPTAVAARKKGKRAGWTITGVRRMRK